MMPDSLRYRVLAALAELGPSVPCTVAMRVLGNHSRSINGALATLKRMALASSPGGSHGHVPAVWSITPAGHAVLREPQTVTEPIVRARAQRSLVAEYVESHARHVAAQRRMGCNETLIHPEGSCATCAGAQQEKAA